MVSEPVRKLHHNAFQQSVQHFGSSLSSTPQQKDQLWQDQAQIDLWAVKEAASSKLCRMYQQTAAATGAW